MLRQLFLLMIVFLGISFSYADSNGVWTYSEDIRPGIVGADESSNPSESFTFNNELIINERSTFNGVLNSNSQIGIGVLNPTYALEVDGIVEGSLFLDIENNNYSVDPFGESIFQIVRSDVYYSRGSNTFYIDPKDYSNVNDTNVEGVLSLRNINIYDIFVDEGQIDSITSAMIVDNSVTSSDLGVDSVGASELVAVYESGSVYDSRFVNEGQLDSIDSGMIIDETITSSDLGVDSVGASELVFAYEIGSAYDSRFVNEGELDSITTDMIVDDTITIDDLNEPSVGTVFATRQFVEDNQHWQKSGTTVYYNTGGVAIGTTATSSGLSLDVNGNAGAIRFCDQNGANCYTASQIIAAINKLNQIGAPCGCANTGRMIMGVCAAEDRSDCGR